MLVTFSLILLAIGLCVLASASIAVGEKQGVASYGILRKQIAYAGVGVVAAFFAARFDYRRYRVWMVPMVIASVGLLLLTLVVGPEINGSRRWIRLGPVQVQTSELAKVALCVGLATWLSRHRRRTAEIRYGLVYPMGLVGLLAVPVFAAPDFGTTFLLVSVALIMLFVTGVRLGPLFLTATLGLNLFMFAVMHSEVRLKRIISFLDPPKYESNESYQLSNALYAFMQGGPSGVGYGHGMQQRHYLPEAHTDFIFAIIGEELGISATLLLLVLFLAVFICGLEISRKAHDPFGRFLALGLTLILTLQAFINMGVVTGILPTKGLPLPFISYGGSSLVISCAMVGILVNIARMTSSRELIDQASPVKDRARFV
ncbi:MAG: putative lipid II flippase FtsW [Kiritimatiellia bacterium]